MDTKKSILVMLITIVVAGVAAPALAQVEGAPVPDVPVIYTIKGQFARISYNAEGWVTLGYRTANDSQGTDWMLLEAGVTVRRPNPRQTLTRAAFSIKLPDGSIVPMASQQEYNKAGYLRALNARGNTVRDSINYFPVQANQRRTGCLDFPSHVLKTLSRS